MALSDALVELNVPLGDDVGGAAKAGNVLDDVIAGDGDAARRLDNGAFCLTVVAGGIADDDLQGLADLGSDSGVTSMAENGFFTEDTLEDFQANEK